MWSGGYGVKKVYMKNPIVEMNGDEMARVIWDWIKNELIEPFVELNTVYVDLSIQSRNETDDDVTLQAVEALRKHKIGVKCPTITPNAERMREYGLRRLFPSPNATIRNRLRATIFRAPFIVRRLTPYVRTWSNPIVIARHGVGDIYDSIEIQAEERSKITISKGDAVEGEILFHDNGVFIGYHITRRSIEDFAVSVFRYALENKMDVWFSAKDTIAKKYDGLYKETFERIFNERFKGEFERLGLSYNYYLIDDAFARLIKSKGGFVWALKNYDGDIASDLVLSAFSGSLAMSISELYSPDGIYYAEASHGTVQKHYYRFLRGETPYTNPIGLIIAWSKALEKRAVADGNYELMSFSQLLISSILEAIDKDGYGTPDIAYSASPPLSVISTVEFIRLIKKKLKVLFSE